jgi:hypothetical protein
MPFNLSVHHGLPYLLVQAGGPATLADLCGGSNLVAGIAAQAGYRRALIDLRQAEVLLPFTEHLQLGTYAASALAAMDRVATIASPANRAGSSEKAAQKSGLRLRTFLDFDEAVQWLESGAPAAC